MSDQLWLTKAQLKRIDPSSRRTRVRRPWAALDAEIDRMLALVGGYLMVLPLASFQVSGLEWKSVALFHRASIKYLSRTSRRNRPGCWSSLSVIVLLAFFMSGCATTADHQLPTVELSARALAPVGGTIPVLIKRQCTANCGSKSTPLTRQQVAALESGQYVQAMSVDEAIKLAGGTQKLLDALNARESRASTIARESTFELQNTSNSIFAVLAVPFASGRAASMAALPDEAIEKMRLNEVTIPDCPPSLESAHGCPIGSDASHLHHDPNMGGEGWVFFPIGKYTQVKASYDWLPSIFKGGENLTEIIITPWNGSSASIGNPDANMPAAMRR